MGHLLRAARSVLRGQVLGGYLLAALLLFQPACRDEEADEGFFDHYDACERLLSLCELSRDTLSACVSWVEQNYPNKVDRILLVECMADAVDCTSMKEGCNLEGLLPVP